MKDLVLMDHDGAIDDLLSQMLLMRMEDKEILGVTVTPADCYIEPAMESAYKLCQFMGQEGISLGRGDYYGINAFPNEWRARPEVINSLPMLINLPEPPDPYAYPEAANLIIQKLLSAPQPVTILMTGPCSNLVRALEAEPACKSKVKQMVWMAGAFRTQGNVQTYQHDGSAEWNVYWDPVNSAKLVEMELPLIMIPLDVTNHVPVNRPFLAKLASQMEFPLSHLAGQMWALTVDTIPSYHYTYYMWDMLATSFLALPEIFTLETVRAKVSVKPPNAGQTMISADGHLMQIALDVKKEVFYEYVWERLRA